MDREVECAIFLLCFIQIIYRAGVQVVMFLHISLYNRLSFFQIRSRSFTPSLKPGSIFGVVGSSEPVRGVKSINLQFKEKPPPKQLTT